MFISPKTYYKTFIEKQYASPETDMYTELLDTYYKIKEKKASEMGDTSGEVGL